VIVLAEVVDWEALGDVVIASVIAGVGVTLCFSLAILGMTRFADLRRAEKAIPAGLYALLGLLGLAASLAGIVAAIVVMTSKG
jgi:hypothetical protein